MFKPLIALAVVLSSSVASANDCESYAALHWHMADSAGYDADGAWEDAYERCEAAETRGAVVRLDTEVE